jgi:hypothetical protein
VHTVTWLDREVQVEGVEADDYPATQALLSQLKHADKKVIRTLAGVPGGYEGFDLVEHRREIDAKYVPRCIAVKIREDELRAWAVHAWLRMCQRRSRPATSSVKPPPGSAAVSRPVLPELPAPPTADSWAVAAGLLAHGSTLAASAGGGVVRFTPDEAANALIHDDPFAFLIAVICDQGIVAERAWAIPHGLRRRLGHLDPYRMAAQPATVISAFAASPSLHRFVRQVAEWVVQAASGVADRYEGDASKIWNDRPSAAGSALLAACTSFSRRWSPSLAPSSRCGGLSSRCSAGVTVPGAASTPGSWSLWSPANSLPSWRPCGPSTAL